MMQKISELTENAGTSTFRLYARVSRTRSVLVAQKGRMECIGVLLAGNNAGNVRGYEKKISTPVLSELEINTLEM